MRFTFLSCVCLGVWGFEAVAQPTNDHCDNAEFVSPHVALDGDSTGATAKGAPSCGVSHAEWPGVWYAIVGDGRPVRASLCGGLITESNISVYAGSCGDLACVTGSDFFCDSPFELRWCAETGVVYYILVRRPADVPGEFTLSVGVSPFPCPAVPENDNCADASPIMGEGIFSFDNAGATMDGPNDCFDPMSTPFVPYDVWHCWTAPQTGSVTVDTCGRTTLDTKLVVYEGCDCDSLVDLACSDDACATQSRVSFEAFEGASYAIRVGTYAYNRGEAQGGAGTFVVTYDPPASAMCSSPEDHCQPRDQWNALLSDGAQATVADNFAPIATEFVSGLCWWGTYFDGEDDCFIGTQDAFEVRYYLDQEGLPGPLIAGPFRQLDLTLLVEPRARTNHRLMETTAEFAYSATHDSVPVLAGVTYWVEIVNASDGSCRWFWEVGRHGDGRAAQDGVSDVALDGYESQDATTNDMALCLDIPIGTITPSVPPPDNDDCTAAALVADGDLITFDTTGATTDPTKSDCGLPCWSATLFPLGDRIVHRDIWFDYVAECSGVLTVSLCDSSFDTKLVVYEGGSCPPPWPLTAIAASDDGCAPVGLPTPQPMGDGTSGDGNASGIFPEPSNCYASHTETGCDDAACAAIVCALLNPICCASPWYNACAEAAIFNCRDSIGDGLQSEVRVRVVSGETYKIRVGGYRNAAGPGAIHVQPGPSAPRASFLDIDYALFAACVTGPSPDGPLGPCCEFQDFNADIAVDLADFAAFSSMVVDD